jgi:hypothetical protein
MSGYQILKFASEQALDIAANVLSGATMQFFLTGTSTPTDAYSDAALTTSIANPLSADTAGSFIPIFLDPLISYRVILKSASGVVLKTWDPANENVLATIDANFIGLALYPLTDAEIVAGVTPVNYAFASGSDQRYGAVGDSTTDDYAALNASLLQFASGGVEPQWRPVTYATTAALSPPTNLVLNLNRATIKPSGSANAFTFADNACGIKNGKIDMTNSTGVGISSTVGGGLQQLLLKDLYILCSSGTGIELVDCYASTMSNVRLNSGTGRALYLRSSIAGTPVNSIWMNRLVVVGFTGTADLVSLEGCTGCHIFEPDIENNNNASGSVCIHITTNANAGSVGNVIRNGYFEDPPSQLGTCILVGSPASGSVTCSGNIIENNYFISSKQPVSLGTFVSADNAPITNNTFMQAVGGTTYGVIVSGSLIPNCHGNSGSLPDISREFTPALKFGGASVGMTGTFTGRYGRVGNKLFGDISITLTAKGSSTGLATITGLPIAAQASTVCNTVAVPYAANMSALTSTPVGRIAGSGTSIALAQFGAAGATDMSEGFFTNTSALRAHFEYEV